MEFSRGAEKTRECVDDSHRSGPLGWLIQGSSEHERWLGCGSDRIASGYTCRSPSKGHTEQGSVFVRTFSKFKILFNRHLVV